MRFTCPLRWASLLGGPVLAACTTTEPLQAPLSDPDEFARPPASCVFQCPPPSSCPEASAPYVCPSLGGYSTIPHSSLCPSWSGKPPAVTAGQCTASAPSGHAIKLTGIDPDDPAVTVMPDGRHLRPAGRSWVFNEPDLFGGMTTNVAIIPGTSLVLTVDTGVGDHVVRLIDTALIGQGNPVLGYVEFAHPSGLNWGMAFAVPDHAYVATADGVVQAFQIDLAARTIARDDARSIVLPPGKNGPWYASGVAVSPDFRRLVVSPVDETQLLIFDIDLQSPTYGQALGTAELGAHETFGVYFDPNDPAGQHAYVSMWADRSVLEVDLSDPAQAAVARSFATDKNPQGIAFLDGRWMVVANDFGDSLTLVDRVAQTVTSLPIDTAASLHGTEPSTLAYDAARKLLYATLAGISAVGAYSVDLSSTPPAITPAGRLPALWWPGAVAVQDDGALVVTSLRGDGTSSADAPFNFTNYDIYSRLHGGIQWITAPSPQDLAAGDAQVKASVEVGNQPGYPTVSCPAGARDFPMPATNTEGPSPVIDHVFILVRENKTFDAILGDFPGVNGKPELTLKKSPDDMNAIWQNLRALARQFVVSDNFYTAAEISTLGHVWTTYGRSSDYDERTWPMAGYYRYDDQPPRSELEAGGLTDVGMPEEGSLFDWLGQHQIAYDILGEPVGSPRVFLPSHPPVDFLYPGGFRTNVAYPDIEKSCYLAGRARVRCDLGSVVYMTLPNDHTLGISPDWPTGELMCAVNDEATGMVVDAISHSPLWASSLIVITEDDTAQGGDHVDAHRTVLAVASPWVKRGYVSKTHTDVSSIHKMIAHVYGLPYPNLIVANASLPFDMFTSTPDYTPFDYLPRRWPLGCGDTATEFESKMQKQWDLSAPDRSMDLDAQAVRWMRGEQLVAPPPAPP